MNLWKLLRDVILTLGGMVGMYHEVFIQTSQRPVLLGGLLAMMGLPLALRADEHREKEGE